MENKKNVFIFDNDILFMNDDHKLYHKYLNKCINAKKNGLECNLSYEEYCILAKDAHLKSSDLGYTGRNYVLARYNDSGDYNIDNCRFITQKENISERKLSEKAILSSRESGKKLAEYTKTIDKDKYSELIKEGQKHSIKYQLRMKMLSEKRKIKESLMDQNRIGSKNSQYGSFWITNGKENGKWRPEFGPIPDGYYKGRIC